jgi:AcrR family transcriptional regulator
MPTATTTRTPQQGRAVRTRAALLKAAAKEFSARGYAATTAKSIAARAKVATGSFYQYFPNKDAALLELAAARAADAADRSVTLLERAQQDALPDDPAKRRDHVARQLRTVVHAVIALHRDDPGLHAVLTERRHVDPKLDALTHEGERRLMDRVAALLRTWGHGGDAEATAFVLYSMLEGSVHAHVLGHPLVDDERLVDALTHAMQRIALPRVP